jgi:hypothetical protein
MVALQQEVERASKGLSPSSTFNQAATNSDLARIQDGYGLMFDAKHLDFLKHSNGWDGASTVADIFGTSDFLGSSRFKEAQEWVNQMDRDVLGAYAKHRANLVPIGKSSTSTDLLLMIDHKGQLQPKVLWFTNELIEEFEDFDQMFLSFKEYWRQAVDYWLSRSQGGLM